MRSALLPPPRGPKLLPAGMLRLVSDERLVEQVRAGSERAFENLFDRHHGPLLAFCRHMLRSQEEAEDAVQQTFLAAYRDLLRSEKPIAPRPWLFTIARNRCVSILRARRERTVDVVSLVGENLAAEVDRREDLRALLADVARLPDDQRAALLLTELSGMPHDEIGNILGCPQDRVKALVFQARSSLAADRTARETPCQEIREQLATLRGAALRRAVLRRHLRDCAGCREYREKLRLQRRQLGALLPVGPSLGLKAGVLGSGGVGLGGATLNAGVLGGSLVARVLVGAAITSGGAAAGVTAITHGGAPPTAKPSVHAAATSGAVQRASAARPLVRAPAGADEEVIPRLAGGPVSPEARAGLSGGQAQLAGAAGGAPEVASAGADSARAPELQAAALAEAFEPPGQPAGQDAADRVEPANGEDRQAPEPSSPANPDEPGQGPPAGSGKAPHADGPASHAHLPQQSGPPAPELPPEAQQRHSGQPAPQRNHPAPPAGHAPEAHGQPSHPAPPAGHAPHPSGQPHQPPAAGHAPHASGQPHQAPVAGHAPAANGQPITARHAPAGVPSARHAKPPAVEPAKSDHAAHSPATPESSPGAAATPGGSAHGASDAGGQGDGKR